jgi:hypothetical protein
MGMVLQDYLVFERQAMVYEVHMYMLALFPGTPKPRPRSSGAWPSLRRSWLVPAATASRLVQN